MDPLTAPSQSSRDEGLASLLKGLNDLYPTESEHKLALGQRKMSAKKKANRSKPYPTWVTSKQALKRDDDVQVIAVKKNNVRGFTLDDIPPGHFYLGGTKFVVVSTYMGGVKVHLRSYRCEQEKYTPTRYGLTISPATFFEMQSDLLRLNRPGQSLTFENELLISRSKTDDVPIIRFQRLYSDKDSFLRTAPGGVMLTLSQFLNLREESEKVWACCKQHLFGSAFIGSILQHKTVTVEPLSGEQAVELTVILASEIRSFLETAAKQLAALNYWEYNNLTSTAQNWEHSFVCSSFTGRAALAHFDKGLSLLEAKDLGERFAKRIQEMPITQGFLKSLSAEEVLKKVANMLEDKDEH